MGTTFNSHQIQTSLCSNAAAAAFEMSKQTNCKLQINLQWQMRSHFCSFGSEILKYQSQIPRPKSQIPRPKSQFVRPKSQILRHKSQIGNKSPILNYKSISCRAQWQTVEPSLSRRKSLRRSRWGFYFFFFENFDGEFAQVFWLQIQAGHSTSPRQSSKGLLPFFFVPDVFLRFEYFLVQIFFWSGYFLVHIFF